MKIYFVLHADFELPGAIETWAKSKDFQYASCRPFAGEALDHPSTFDWLIVMGGPQSPLKIEEAPYLQDEINFLRDVMAVNKPVLGFCLGAQLIGEALGASTERSPEREIGVFPIQLTEEGLNDALLAGLPPEFPIVHWHNDMPGLTPDAKVLASSQGCPRQIVRYAAKAYGFQCHPEPTLDNIRAMIEYCPGDLKPGLFVQSPEAFLKNDFQTMNRVIFRVLDNLYALEAVETTV